MSQLYHGLFLFFCLLLFLTGCSGLPTSHDLNGEADDNGMTVLAPARLDRLLARGTDLVLIDIRSRIEYRQGHLPGALSRPVCRRQQEKQDSLPADHDLPVVVYCGWQGCSGLAEAVKDLQRKGFERVAALDGGVEAWLAAGFPLAASDDLVLSGTPLLIDLRPAHKDTVMRIPGSISIPFPVLAKRRAQLPADGLFVFYSDRASETKEALRYCRQAGLRAVMVEGNLQGWRHRGGQLTSGPVRTAIRWTSRLQNGEVSADALARPLAGNDKNILLLDVGTDQAAAASRPAAARHIPLDRLASQAEQLKPGGRTVIVYGDSGAQAELGMEILLGQGYRTRFFSGQIRCASDGCRAVSRP